MTSKWIKLQSFILILALGACGKAALAQDANVLTGTLKKIHNTGVVTIGYRDSSIPFSYLSSRNKPIGYSIDICRTLVDAISEDVGRDVNIKWVQVNPESRLNAVASGQVDMECGSTSANIEREQKVAFSPITFVAGTKLMVAKDSPIKSFRDLQGKTVVVTAGTTNEKALHELQDKLKVNFNLVTAKEHADSFAMLAAHQADAFATDDVLLYGLLARNKLRDTYSVVGDFLSYEPYGIVYRKNDPKFAKLVNDTFAAMAESHELEIAYNHWFLERLPSGDRLELPMSPQLDSIFRSLAVKPE